MANAGILMHIRHLETVGWERLVWGIPEEDSLGSLPKVAELLLSESIHEPITAIVFGCGPSTKDGFSEGDYTKRYLLDNLPRLAEFPRLKEKLNNKTLKGLKTRLEEVIVTRELSRSIDEVVEAARIFSEHKVSRVYQITSASHAPRCVQIQAAARLSGLIPPAQQWFVVADDRCYEGAEPFSTLVMEPPHRGDDPMLGFEPLLPELMRSYQYDLSIEDKKHLTRLVAEFMRAKVEASGIRSFASSK